MNTDLQTKADILKTVWSQDFQGVEALRGSVYNVLSALTVASFALSSFLIHNALSVRLITDFLMILFVWTIFLILKRDIRNRRKALVYRQKLIEKLNKDAPETEIKVFGDASKIVPDIKDTDLIWIPMVSTAAILLKALVLWKV